MTLEMWLVQSLIFIAGIMVGMILSAIVFVYALYKI